METFIGFVILICILSVAHYAQIAAQQLKSLNSKIDELIRLSKEKQGGQ